MESERSIESFVLSDDFEEESSDLLNQESTRVLLQDTSGLRLNQQAATGMMEVQNHANSSHQRSGPSTSMSTGLSSRPILTGDLDGSACISLIDSCNESDLDEVRRIFEGEGAVNEANDDESLLSLACSSGYLELSQPLITTSQATMDSQGTATIERGRNVAGSKISTNVGGVGGLVVTQTGTSGQTITLGSASQLSEFITSMKPPTIPGTSIQDSQQTLKTPPGLTATIVPKTNLGQQQQAKKPTPIAPAPVNLPTSSSGKIILTADIAAALRGVVPASNNLATHKLIMSPDQVSAKQFSGQKGSASVTNTLAVNQSGQQIVFLSPVKTGQATKPGLKTLAPAPANKVVPGLAQGKDIKSGNQVQIIKLVTSTSTSGKTTTLRTIAPSPKSGSTTASLVSAIGEALAPGQKVTLIPASSAKGITSTTPIVGQAPGTFLTAGSAGGQVIVIPANMLQGGTIIQTKAGTSTAQNLKIKLPPLSTTTDKKMTFVPIAPSPVAKEHKIVTADRTANGHFLPVHHVKKDPGTQSHPVVPVPADDAASRQRKPCNCTKSQCLKLYCDCFANGEFCHNCNCNNCSNNLEHEDERQRAVRLCLERNPHAFHPKIGKGRITNDYTERRHMKGCNCRRSGCLKNYCECYEAKILCTELCKCCGCKNYEDSFERKSLQLMNLADAAEFRSNQQSVATKLIWGNDYQPKLPVPMTSDRLPVSFITQEVIDATSQCLMATAQEGEKNGQDYATIEKSLISEFGRCLKQIIECANKVKS